MSSFLSGTPLWWRPLFFSFFLFFLFANSLQNDFIFDDEPLTVRSSFALSDQAPDLWKTYRPVRAFSYYIDRQLFGDSPVGFRFMNIFYHLLVCFALYWLLLELAYKKEIALLAIVLFAAHPIHTDAVSYIAGRRDVLMALFYVLSMAFFIRFHTTRLWRYLLGASFCMLLSVATKEMGATIPLVCLLYLVCAERGEILKRKWFIPSIMLLLATFSLFAFWAIYSGGSGLVSMDSLSFHGNSLQTHYLTASTIFIYYIKQTIFPLQLILDNANYPLEQAFSIKVIFSFLGMLLFFALITVLWHKKYRSISFWLIFFLITLLPVLQIVPLHEIVAEHYLYLPSVSFCVLVAMGLSRLILAKDAVRSRIPKYLGVLLLLLIMLFFSVRTITRNTELRNIWTVLHADERWRPLSFRGLYALGAQYMDMRFPDKAFEYYQKAHATGYRDQTLAGNTILYFIVKGDMERAEAIFEEYAKKSEVVENALARLHLAYYSMSRGDCAHAKDLLAGVKAPDLQKEFRVVAGCEKQGFIDDDAPAVLDAKILKLKELHLDALMKYYIRKRLAQLSFHVAEYRQYAELLAQVNLLTDVPEAIIWYDHTVAAYRDSALEIPPHLAGIVKILTQYQHEVLVEGRYYRLDF